MSPFERIIAIREARGIPHVQKIILFVIASHMGINEYAFPSFATLQAGCGIKKRTSISSNINQLIESGILKKIPPGDGFKSNRYSINFELLVTDGYQSSVTSNENSAHELVTVGYRGSNRRLPDQSPSVTRLVTDGYPKENINKTKRKLKTTTAVVVENFAHKKKENENQKLFTGPIQTDSFSGEIFEKEEWDEAALKILGENLNLN